MIAAPQQLTAEEEVLAAMLADAVLEYARRNLKKMKRAKRNHEPIPLPTTEEPTPTGCVWIGDRVILPEEDRKKPVRKRKPVCRKKKRPRGRPRKPETGRRRRMRRKPDTKTNPNERIEA